MSRHPFSVAASTRPEIGNPVGLDAVASYLVFLGTFLYAIAFVGGFAVPRRLHGPPETSLSAALAILPAPR